MSKPTTVKTWHLDPEAENAMGQGHAPIWRHMIGLVPEQDLTGRTVLDFGCNQGGFLRLLYAMRPFARGLGLDITTDSIARANALKGDLPLQYEVIGDLAPWEDAFDLAFSHEALYLLPDLDQHAATMARLLRQGGVYYAVTGCHVDNPLWPHWRDFIPKITSVPVSNHAIEDYAAAFRRQGLAVTARKLRFDGFIAVEPGGGWYPKVWDELNYLNDAKIMFRIAKP